MEKKIPINVLSNAEYDCIFEEIKSIPKSLKSDQILAILAKKLVHPVVIMQEIPKETREIINIYRVRVLKNGDKIKDIHDPQEFSYPPKECCELQRCNFESEQVFYGAVDPVTPFYEAKKSITLGKSIAYLSKWGIKDCCPDPLWCQRMFYGLPENEECVSGIFSSALKEGIKKTLPDISEEQFNGIIYYLKKYQELFTSDENYYHITASIVNDLFKNYHGKELANGPQHTSANFAYPPPRSLRLKKYSI